MDTVQKIKQILERKSHLEENIKTARHAIAHVNMSGNVGFFTNSNTHLMVRVSKDKTEKMLYQQIETDKHELSKIDLQLNAIGSLMCCDNENKAATIPQPANPPAPLMPQMPQEYIK